MVLIIYECTFLFSAILGFDEPIYPHFFQYPFRTLSSGSLHHRTKLARTGSGTSTSTKSSAIVYPYPSFLTASRRLQISCAFTQSASRRLRISSASSASHFSRLYSTKYWHKEAKFILGISWCPFSLCDPLNSAGFSF